MIEGWFYCTALGKWAKVVNADGRWFVSLSETQP